MEAPQGDTLIDLPVTPSLRLEGKRALVTGAGRGIGLALAAALSQSGAHVTLCARTSADIEAGAAAIQAAGYSADTLTLDVADLAQVRARLEERGSYTILINNAGTNRPRTFIDVTEEDYDAVMNLNVRAAFFVAQTVARRMIEEGATGSIINVSSQMGHVGGADRSVYCASKAAMEGMTKAMAIDLAPFGIRVNTLCPTFIETPMTKPFFADPRFHERVLDKIKIGRLGRVEDLMGAAVFMASDAAALMTGTSLLIDGGWTAE